MEKVHNMRTTATHKDRTFRKSSTTVQVQDNFNFKFKTTSTKFQEHTTNMLCYDPQLQGYFIWHCHLSHDPLAATSLDHRCTLVQVTYNTFKSSATSCKNIPKTEQWKTVDKLNCKTMTTVKLLNTSSNESTCVQLHASDIQLVTKENSWHQIQKQWNEHHMNWHHKTWRIQNCCNCQTPTKPMHSFCKIVGRLLQTELDPLTTVPYTASASSSELTASVVPRTASALKNVDNKQQNVSKCKTTDAFKFKRLAIQFQMTCNQVQMTCNPLFWLSAARLCTLGYSWVNLEAIKTYSPSYAHSRCSFSQTKS